MNNGSCFWKLHRQITSTHNRNYMVTINKIEPTEDDRQNVAYNYQKELTAKLDNLNSDFDQNTINEIVLWKVSRYVLLDTETLTLINKINKNDKQLNHELTKDILFRLLAKEQKGVRLAMASTILRYKNPQIYQIIDQRVYRFLYSKELKYSESNIDEQIQVYLDYLQKLKEECKKHIINFELADRIFYTMDKKHNVDKKLNGY